MKKLQFKKFEKYLKKYSYNLNKIVGIDPFDFNNVFLLENGILSQISTKDVKQEYLISSYIPNNKVINYEFKLQKNLLDKIELSDYIETKCYEDVGLDEAEEYIFKYKIINSELDDKNVTVEVAIISKKDLEDFYQPIKKDYGYLDFTTYSGFVFSVLYNEKILEKQNDLYIYFTKDGIIITLYSEGEFLQTSIIPEGLENIYEELIQSIKIKDFNFEIFLKLLVTKGLDLNNYSEKEHILFNELSELFSNKFLMISNQLHSIIRKFSLTTIDRIFMSTMKGSMPGISEFANMYLGVEANDLKFDTNYNPNNIEIDQILFLSMLYARYAYKKNVQVDNFTTFYRPPTFFYRKSGQFISISVASLILSLVYPLYQSMNTFILESENNNMKQTLSSLNQINKKLKNQNNSLKKELKLKKQEKENLLKYISTKEQIINYIYLEKKGYIPKSVLISRLSKYLYLNKVYIEKIEYDKTQQELKLDVYANDNKNITNFIDEVVQQEHLIVTTPGYKKIDNFYKAQVIIKVEK